MDERETELEELHRKIAKYEKNSKRQEKIMSRSDKRQKYDYDELQEKLAEVQELQDKNTHLMDSFIELIAGAIDAKSKYTGGHCSRVPELTKMLVDAASSSDEPAFVEFTLSSDDAIRELNIAAWLHDCGKVTTPEYIVDKATKLETIYNRIHEIRTRFEVIHRDLTIEALEKKLAGEEARLVEKWLEDEHAKLQSEFMEVAKANIGSEFMNDEDKNRIKKISQRTWVRNFDDTLGLASEERLRVKSEQTQTPQVEQLLSNKARHIIPRDSFNHEEYEQMGFKIVVPENLYNLGEVDNLCIEAGTLTYEDRFKIQEHIIMTIKMLEKLPFPSNLKNVPLYAGAHHETLIGTGYPRKLSKKDMPLPSRAIAIADVFEALTASDRPYKEPKNLSTSIKILASMVKKEHLDPHLFELFLRSGIYKKYAEKYLREDQIDDVDIREYL